MSTPAHTADGRYPSGGSATKTRPVLFGTADSQYAPCESSRPPSVPSTTTPQKNTRRVTFALEDFGFGRGTCSSSTARGTSLRGDWERAIVGEARSKQAGGQKRDREHREKRGSQRAWGKSERLAGARDYRPRARTANSNSPGARLFGPVVRSTRLRRHVGAFPHKAPSSTEQPQNAPGSAENASSVQSIPVRKATLDRSHTCRYPLAIVPGPLLGPGSSCASISSISFTASALKYLFFFLRPEEDGGGDCAFFVFRISMISVEC